MVAEPDDLRAIMLKLMHMDMKLDLILELLEDDEAPEEDEA
jgi:hypothetical protein